MAYLPPYSPELNLVEGFWKWMKETIVNNVFYSRVQDIRLNVRNIDALFFTFQLPFRTSGSNSPLQNYFSQRLSALFSNKNSNKH